jgi:hypothetical protein
MTMGSFCVGAYGGEVKGYGKAFEGTAEVQECGAEDAFERGLWVGQALGATHDAVEAVLLLMGGGEDGALTPEQIDVAGEAVERVFFGKHEFDAKGFEGFGLIGAGEGPGVALGG